jgi:hypothetical protein
MKMTMRLFAVRLINDHEPLGFFFVRSLSELVDMVDRYDDPAGFEYKPINNTSVIIWPREVSAWKMGVRDGALADKHVGDPQDPALGLNRAVSDRIKLVNDGLEFDAALDGTGGLWPLVSGCADTKGWKPLVRFERVPAGAKASEWE